VKSPLVENALDMVVLDGSSVRCVLVEDGVASRTMAAYIDLNPVRAEKRTSGARKLRGHAAAAAGRLWSVRDLQKGIG
jgi:hypothetical protein